MSEVESGAIDYVIRFHADGHDVDALAWNALLDAQDTPTPFMRHEFLRALIDSGSAQPASGWTPVWITLTRGNRLHAGTCAWLKAHSYGEYVFDWAWADAYHRHGLAYYPKLLVAVPFSPVPGTRLMATDAAARRVLVQALRALADRADCSSAHVLFGDAADFEALSAEGWLLRDGVQFHWRNRAPVPYADFADFLAALQREKRKKIQQERRRVREAGITFDVREGEEISSADWDFFYRCYTRTYRDHGSTPYLTRDFFHRVASELTANWLMFVAHLGGQPIAASLVTIDPARKQAWGRYWGAVSDVPLLHFEACYYQPLQWCIARGYARFEGGAQGEHKMARGLTTAPTRSAHWLAHPQFARAVDDFLSRERAGVAAYVDELNERSPFREAPERATQAQSGDDADAKPRNGALGPLNAP